MKSIKNLIILAIVAIFAFQTIDCMAQETDSAVAPKTYTFVERNGQPLQLDIYHPTLACQPKKGCVVYMFGGGFAMGSRSDELVQRFCRQMADYGYTAVAIDYRLHLREVNFDTVGLFNMQGVFRDAINIAATDCAASIRFLVQHAEELGIADCRFVLCGSSAGAISVLQLDYCRTNGMPPAAELPDGFVPAGVVAYAGGVFANGGKPKYKSAPAPTFFLHGKKDKIVNYSKFPPLLRTGLYGPKKLHKVFEKNNYSHWFFRFEDIGHEVASLMGYTFTEFCAFVDKALDDRQMNYDATIRDTHLKPTKWTNMNVFELYNN